jgi:hypothetical protein
LQGVGAALSDHYHDHEYGPADEYNERAYHHHDHGGAHHHHGDDGSTLYHNSHYDNCPPDHDHHVRLYYDDWDARVDYGAADHSHDNH